MQERILPYAGAAGAAVAVKEKPVDALRLLRALKAPFPAVAVIQML